MVMAALVVDVAGIAESVATAVMECVPAPTTSVVKVKSDPTPKAPGPSETNPSKNVTLIGATPPVTVAVSSTLPVTASRVPAMRETASGGGGGGSGGAVTVTVVVANVLRTPLLAVTVKLRMTDAAPGAFCRHRR